MTPKNIRKKYVQNAIKTGHDERCSECKATIESMLRNIYGSVKRNHRFEVGTRPEDYKDYPFYKDLKAIFKELQNYRNHMDFVKRRTLPRCDFFVPEPGIIIEFDESQHFTFCRKLTLLLYPEYLAVGFSVKKWIELCDIINAKDNNPPYRDEQRAWYDTLRDFLPLVLGLRPTVRLYSRDFQWCSMDPENPYHLKIFKEIVEGKSHGVENTLSDADPPIPKSLTSEWVSMLSQGGRRRGFLCIAALRYNLLASGVWEFPLM